MSLLQGIAMDYLVWWHCTSRDGYGGFVWSPPVEIQGRYESSDGRSYIEQGEQRQLIAEVLTETNSISRGDVIYLGRMSSLTQDESEDPMLADRALSVKTVTPSKTLDGGSTHYEIGLGNL